MRCAAKSKRTQQQCRKMAMPNGKCYHHGGVSLPGALNPAFKSGKYSKAIPARMAATYDAAVKDKRILEMQDDIALLDARVEDLLKRTDLGEAGRLWRLALQTYHTWQQARGEGDTDKSAEANRNLGAILRQGCDDYQAWDEVSKTLEQKRRMIESEQKRQAQEKLLVPIAELGLVVRALAAAVSTHITDVAVLRAINSDWERLLGRTPVEPVEQ